MKRFKNILTLWNHINTLRQYKRIRQHVVIVKIQNSLMITVIDIVINVVIQLVIFLVIMIYQKSIDFTFIKNLFIKENNIIKIK